MSPIDENPDPLIPELLSDPRWDGHPLREALEALWTKYGKVRGAERERQRQRLDKILRICDLYQERLLEHNVRLHEASTHDMLTGLPNRRLLMARLKRDAARSLQHGEALTVALADLDHFKQVNDRWGHATGDAALYEVAQAIKRSLRDGDLCGRWGGEEFLILLPRASLAQARVIAQRVTAAVSAVRVEGIPPEYRLGVSLGLASWSAGDRPEDVVQRADAALYGAKHAGRNRVVIAGGE